MLQLQRASPGHRTTYHNYSYNYIGSVAQTYSDTSTTIDCLDFGMACLQ